MGGIMTKKTFEALGIKEQRVKKLMLKGIELMLKSQMNPEKFFEVLKDDEETNEKEKLWLAHNAGSALQLSTNEKLEAVGEKYEKFVPIIMELAETTKNRSDVVLRVLKMTDLTLLEKIILCYDTGRIIEALYGPSVPQAPGMKRGFAK